MSKTTYRVVEFNQTPFVGNMFVYSRLLSFTSKDQMYIKGDVAVTDAGVVFRIDELTYVPVPMMQGTHTEQLDLKVRIPTLQVTGTTFITIAGSNEIVLTRVVIRVPAAEIAKKAAVSYLDQFQVPTQTETSVLWCRRRLDHDGGSLFYRPPVVKMTYDEVLCATPMLLADIYIDKYSSSKTGSTEGIYLRVANTLRSMRDCPEFTYVVALLRRGTNLQSAFRQVHAQLLAAANGVPVWDCKSSSVLTVKLKIAGFPADHIQACMLTRTLGNNALVNGRSCLVLKESLFDGNVNWYYYHYYYHY